MSNPIFDKKQTKKIKLQLTEFEVTNILCKLMRTDNEYTRKLKKFIKKETTDNSDICESTDKLIL